MKPIHFLIAILCLINVYLYWDVNVWAYTHLNRLSFAGNEAPRTLPEVFKMTTSSIIAHIAYEASLAGIDPIIALQIAKRESGYNPLAKNPHSSARGLFQVISSTWKYCEGNIWDPQDNTACFIRLYPKHPEYWKI